MSILSRVSIILRSKLLGAVDCVEDPRETLSYACQRQEEMLADVRRSLVEVTASKHRLAAQIQRLEQRLQTTGRPGIARRGGIPRRLGPASRGASSTC